jgi:two-component system chemotaxis sensor kinase CheA
MLAHDELLADFIAEAWEAMDRLDQGVLQLEKSPGDQLTVANVFRAIHTIKGSSGFFGLKRIERLSHAAETLLGHLRDGSIALTPARTNALLAFLDGLRQLISGLEAHKTEAPGEDTALIERLRMLSSADEDLPQTPLTVDVPAQPATEPVSQPMAQVVVPATGTPAMPHVPHEAAPPQESLPEARGNDALAPVKVSVELLDDMVNNVSELVLARNRLLPYAQQHNDRVLASIVTTIDRLTLTMQERVLKTRMQTLGQLWSRIPRLARDVSLACGKEVEVVCRGQDTELDRAMLDALKDPVMHVLRNCIDHGIESPQERLAAGKPRQGQVLIDARHENGTVVVVLEDDGRGLDMAAIGQRAIARGLVSPEALPTLSEDQLSEFIFLPGFSTREEVTEISGRGVGMDVVRTNLSAVGGHIRMRSIWGHGTRCTLTVPLTLAIIPALLVMVGDEHYAMPQAHVRELIRHKPGLGTDVIEDFYGTLVLRRRQQLIPLYDLRQWVQLPERHREPCESWHIVVMEVADLRFGLLVDEILNLQEIVIKPLPAALQQGSLFSGATIQGDGRVALILDVGELARRSGSNARLEMSAEQAQTSPKETEDSVAMLLVQIPNFGLSAIPMTYVWRLDKVEARMITQRAGHAVLPYQGHVVRLLDLEHLLVPQERPHSQVYDHQMDIVMCWHGQALVGLVVQHIVGMADVPQQLHQADTHQFGLQGMVLHQGEVINVLHLPQLLHGTPVQNFPVETMED